MDERTNFTTVMLRIECLIMCLSLSPSPFPSGSLDVWERKPSSLLSLREWKQASKRPLPEA
jgi:hypothetical protein